MACWVCGHSAESGKQLSEVGGSRSATGLEMMHFCLDIQLDVDSAESIILCHKCCSKLISFYKFKCQAMKSFSYFTSIIADDIQMKTEEGIEDLYKTEKDSGDNVKAELKTEDDSEVKEEPKGPEEVKRECEEWPEPVADSDDERLSSLRSGADQQTKGSTPQRKRERTKQAFRVKKGPKAGVCDLCGASVRDVAEHLKRHRPAGERPRVPCRACGKTFATYSSRYRHNRTEHLGIRPYCDACGKHVADKRTHDLTVHNPEKMRHPCVVCGLRFPLPSALDAHMLTHTKLRPFPCPRCGDAFRTKGLMVNHVRGIHEKEKTHLCQYCSKGFFKKHHLTVHIRTHTNERPLSCAECEKRFRTLSALRMHQRRHRGERDHPCPLCDGSFYNAGALKVHMVSHTKEKRYPCKYCGVKFGRTDHRNRHERTAHAPHAPPTSPPPAPPAS